MTRTIPLLILALAVVLSGCGSGGAGGAVESALEAVGLSENVDVNSNDPDFVVEPGSVEEVLVQLGDTDFSGIVMIDDGGELGLSTYGYADANANVGIDEHTVFDIGSLTKQFTGAALLRLEMDGLVSVDAPLDQYLPELTSPLAEVTLHQLLTHTAGLPDAIGDDYEAIDRATYLERAMAQAAEPGEFRYSNTGYSLLGMVIESVSGVTYEQYLHDVLFEPAGMDSTGYVLPDWKSKSIAIGYDGDTALGTPNEQPWADDGPYWNLRANGGILSTADDMRRWHKALRKDDILSDEAKDKLFGRHVSEGDGADSFYGYGWASFPLGDDRWFHGHNGGNGVFFADLLRFPDDDVMIFLASNRSGADEDVAFRLASRVLGSDAITPVCSPLGDISSLPTVASFPDTVAGSTADAFTTILLGGGDAARRAFAERHVSEALSQGLSIDDQATEIGLLQEEFEGYAVEVISIQDEFTIHVLLTSEASPEDRLVSVAVDVDDPVRLSCVSVDVT